MNCGIGDDQVEHVLRNAHNLPVVKSVKEVVVLCGTNNLNQNSTEDITDGVIEVASNFKFKYGYISISICGIFPRDYNWIKIGCILKRSIIFYKKNAPSRVLFLFVQTATGLFKMVFSSSRTKSSLSYSTSNPRFSQVAISFRKLRHISLSSKFCMILMMLVNVNLPTKWANTKYFSFWYFNRSYFAFISLFTILF